MKFTMVAAAALVSSLALAGCSTPQDANAARGAVIGGTSGAIIGGLLSGRPAGALAGGAIGAASGAVLGAASTPRPLPPLAGPPGPPCLRWGYDAYGEPVCLKIARY
ncbi:MAG TPA: hypothetical protein VH414_21395 [Lichenihabitans sp.]|jgi:hypothetical protein|nr:hypothetical protein [Lichenihabitans sp.]